MEIATKIAPIVLALIMLGLGLGLSIKDFTRILRNPSDFFVGFICQLVVLPIVALGVALILNLPAPLAVGLIRSLKNYVKKQTSANGLSQFFRS